MTMNNSMILYGSDSNGGSIYIIICPTPKLIVIRNNNLIGLINLLKISIITNSGLITAGLTGSSV